jgi:hypothetical protein
MEASSTSTTTLLYLIVIYIHGFALFSWVRFTYTRDLRAWGIIFTSNVLYTR